MSRTPDDARGVDTRDLCIEAARQKALLHALFSPLSDSGSPIWREAGVRAQRGLAVYRANGTALAERALAAAFPLVHAMVGAEDFAQIARTLWRAHPPQQGDVSEWGGALPDWIAAQPDLAEWPWLADCARLDWARHACERAADAELDAGSLALLGEVDPPQLALVLAPGTWALASRWPLAAIHAAHGDAPHQVQGGTSSGGPAAGATSGDAADDAARFEPVRAALAEGRGQAVIVAREGWRAAVHEVDATTANWMLDLLAGRSLADALERSGEAFDFAAWLQRALMQGWMKGVARRAD